MDIARIAVGLVSLSLAALGGCSCQSGAADGGLARDAAAPCPGPVRFQRYELSPAFGDATAANIDGSVTLPDQRIVTLSVTTRTTDGVTFLRWLAAIRPPSNELVPIELPPELSGDAFFGTLVDLGDRVGLLGASGEFVTYGSEGFGPVQRLALLSSGTSTHEILPCGPRRAVVLGVDYRSSSAAYGAAVVDWSSGEARISPMASLAFDDETMSDLRPAIAGCAPGGDGQVYAVVLVPEGTSMPRLLRGDARGLRATAFGMGFEASAVAGEQLLTLGGGVARYWDVSGAEPRVITERALSSPYSDLRGSARIIESGTLFLFDGGFTFGVLWDGTRLSDPWSLPASVDLDRTGHFWSELAELRFCEAG